MTTFVTPRSVSPVLEKAIEGSWLITAALVPVALAPEDSMFGLSEVPKVFVLRSMAVLMLALLAFEWALREPSQTSHGPLRPPALRQWFLNAIDRHNSRPVILAVLAVVLLANLIALLFAPIKSIGVWGIDAGWDGYGLVSTLSYLVVFVVVATHLKSRAQFERLVWVLAATSILLGLYGVGQHFGIDWFRNDPLPAQRAMLTFGNPVFAGAWMLMPVPLTLAVWQARHDQMSTAAHISIGAALVALPIVAISFTVGRGSIISLAFALFVFLAGLVWVFGSKATVRPAASIAIAVLAAVVLNLLPADDSPAAPSLIAERFAAVGSPSVDSLSGRYEIWDTAVDAFSDFPWVNTKLFPALPDLGFGPLRPLVGYGPDTFRYAYLLSEVSPIDSDLFVDSVPEHDHNFAVHTALELGLLGLFAYAALAVTAGLALVRTLFAAKRGDIPPWLGYLAVGLGSVFAGRMLEQTVGKARVSDLALSWVLVGVVVALTALRADQPAERGVAHAIDDVGHGAAERPGEW